MNPPCSDKLFGWILLSQLFAFVGNVTILSCGRCSRFRSGHEGSFHTDMCLGERGTRSICLSTLPLHPKETDSHRQVALGCCVHALPHYSAPSSPRAYCTPHTSTNANIDILSLGAHSALCEILFRNGELNLLWPDCGCPLQAGTEHGWSGRAPGR